MTLPYATTTSDISSVKSGAAPLQNRSHNLPPLPVPPTKFGKQHTPAATINRPPLVLKSSDQGKPQEKSREPDNDHDVILSCGEQTYHTRCLTTSNIYSQLFSNPATYQPYQMVNWKNRRWTTQYEAISDPPLPAVRSTQWPILYWDRRAAVIVCCHSDAPPLEPHSLHSAEVYNFSETAKEVWAAAGNAGEKTTTAVQGGLDDDALQPRNSVQADDGSVEKEASNSALLSEAFPSLLICMVSVFPSTIRIILLQWGQEAHTEYSKSRLHLSICDPIVETLPSNLPQPYAEVDWVQCYLRHVFESAQLSKEKGCGQ